MEYYIEYTTIDNTVKVTAIDPESGLEASVICPRNTAQKSMNELAIRKLHYLMKKTGHES